MELLNTEIRSMKLTLDSIENGTIFIKTTGNVKAELNAREKIIKLAGREQGSIDLEEQTGILLRAEDLVEGKGNVDFNGTNMIMTVRNGITIKGERLK